MPPEWTPEAIRIFTEAGKVVDLINAHDTLMEYVKKKDILVKDVAENWDTYKKILGSVATIGETAGKISEYMAFADGKLKEHDAKIKEHDTKLTELTGLVIPKINDHDAKLTALSDYVYLKTVLIDDVGKNWTNTYKPTITASVPVIDTYQKLEAEAKKYSVVVPQRIDLGARTIERGITAGRGLITLGTPQKTYAPQTLYERLKGVLIDRYGDIVWLSENKLFILDTCSFVKSQKADIYKATNFVRYFEPTGNELYRNMDRIRSYLTDLHYKNLMAFAETTPTELKKAIEKGVAVQIPAIKDALKSYGISIDNLKVLSARTLPLNALATTYYNDILAAIDLKNGKFPDSFLTELESRLNTFIQDKYDYFAGIVSKVSPKTFLSMLHVDFNTWLKTFEGTALKGLPKLNELPGGFVNTFTNNISSDIPGLIKQMKDKFYMEVIHPFELAQRLLFEEERSGSVTYKFTIAEIAYGEETHHWTIKGVPEAITKAAEEFKKLSRAKVGSLKDLLIMVAMTTTDAMFMLRLASMNLKDALTWFLYGLKNLATFFSGGTIKGAKVAGIPDILNVFAGQSKICSDITPYLVLPGQMTKKA